MRFLICLLSLPDSTPSMQMRVYPLKHATESDEVSYPLNTVLFTFAEADSIEDIHKDFLIFKPYNGIEIGNLSFKQRSGQKIFIVGKKFSLGGEDFVFNSNTETFLPYHDDGSTVIIPD